MPGDEKTNLGDGNRVVDFDDLRLKQREMELKEQELDLKRREASRARWNNPLTVGLLGGLLALSGVLFQNIQQRNALALEERKFEFNLMLEAIRTGDAAKAQTNVLFFLDAGVIADPDGKLRKLIAQPVSQPVPQLPSAKPSTNAVPN